MFQDFGNFSELLFGYVFYYPFFMSYLWMAGALFYWLHYERKGSNPANPPKLPEYPKISLIVPCHNEGDNARDTVENLLSHDYPDFEVIAVNDGSSDNTGAILDEMAQRHPKLRVVHLAQNQGKAMALTAAAMVADSQYFICVDGDAQLHPHAALWMMSHFLNSPRVGAVTGNPRIRTRSTLLGRTQVGEFSSIIGLIKRAQRTLGRVFTVSGVAAGFRRAALHDVGYWSKDMLTEDIDISWKLQLAHWDIRFEPAATCWILMPETLRGLWKQRLRWAMGGVQAILKYGWMWKSWRKRRMWPVYIEFILSMVWGYAMLTTIILWIAGLFLPMPASLYVPTLMPGWTGVLLAATCLLQMGLSLIMDRRYDCNLLRNYFWVIWYPMAFWLIGMLTSVTALPKTLLREKGARAVWVSPDRGIK
ncbi:poly-beta-1,6-N-acetyl-D-glucosamine synthase [Sulfurirhabdus autotrophica]|uniref:Poly-beta-1,6-N-acetyl-D-glucosamine synthase n=1 Tax=Sulfurirhabdus autotrophica TaxID=1706046 RepID=A0A4R3Y4V4_9PROT|nr:poly-beta-1,6-N-acetyl-D-glucosamine synthase [Sulfurirhabdus autotrophica]TCV85153.1 biofilm PGA synthesis N-glycosyltransferase PgaC [Sulfurirhabdus autotrophica]